jgi:hypothetical protein
MPEDGHMHSTAQTEITEKCGATVQFITSALFIKHKGNAPN